MASFLAETIIEELAARRWSTTDLAIRMGGNFGLNKLCVDLLIAVDHPNLRLDQETADGLGRAFDVSPEFFLSLAKARHPVGQTDQGTTLRGPDATD